MWRTPITRCMLVSVEAVLLAATLIFSVGASTYNLLAMQGNVMAEEASVILQRGTAGSSIIYAHGTSALAKVVLPQTRFHYPGSCNIVAGSYISGFLPTSVQTVDNSYFIVGSAQSATSTLQYYPSAYSLLGSTTHVSGSLADLQSNDGAYMTFRSYGTAIDILEDYVDRTSNVDGVTDIGTHSDFPAMRAGPDSVFDVLTEGTVMVENTAAKTSAFIAYRDSTTTLHTPKERTWTGETISWGSQAEMPTSGSPVRYARVAHCPVLTRATERIVVTLSDDGFLDAYVWNGTTWLVTNNIGQAWTTAPTTANRPYDIAYESISGRALLVYGTTVAGGTNDLAYRIWTHGTGWSAEMYYDDTGHAAKITVTYVVLASDPNSNRIGLAYIDGTNSDANAVIWDGSTWGNFIEITGTVSITTEECVAIACETLSGAFIAAAGESEFIKWARFTTSWSAVSIFDINSGAASAMNWLKLASSQTNRIMLTSVCAGTDLCTAVWDTNSVGNRQWSTTADSIGSMTATTSVTAMRFTAQASKSVTNILVFIHTAVSPPAYRFGIETSTTAHLPSGTYVGGASNYAVATPTTTGWLNLTLPSPAPLTAGTVYHITVRYDSGTIGTSNYIALRRTGTVNNNFRVTENTLDPWLNTISGTTIQNRDPVFVLKYSDGTYEAMPYDTASAHNIFGANWFSQKWTQIGNQIIIGVNIPLVKTGTPPDHLYVVLRDETAAQDIATITIPQADITTTLQWYERYFSSPVTLISGRVYRLILRSPGSTSSAYFTCRSLATLLSGGGALTYDGANSVYSASTNSGSTWTDTVTRDLTYILLTSDGGVMGWVVHAPHDAAVDTHAQRCADFAWEYNPAPMFRNQGLLVFGTTAGQISWRRFRSPNFFTSVTNFAMGANIHPWVQLKSNPRNVSGDVKILGAVLEGTVFDLGGIIWDGTTFTVIGTTTFSSDTTVITYECFEIEFMWFGPPTITHQLDLEVQWTNVEYTRQNEMLCIYAGTLGTESLKVDVWTGTGWTNIVSALDAGWNNVSVSAYLTSSTFTIRFRDAITLNDASQTSWSIDCALLRVWNTLYIAEVEFTGASNAALRWSQLAWIVDSCLTVASVDVTLQLYDYAGGHYPTSGDGYISYTSSATPGTDETKSQTITANPERFRDSSGNWKIKVRCVKVTPVQFDFKADWIKFEVSAITQYRASTEFFFTELPADTPAQLNITIVSHYNVTGVGVTIQLWNYASNSYAESGEGYLQYVSSGVNETKTLILTANPESYTRNGEAKIKITGVGASAAPFQQETNMVELCFHSFKYDYVLKIVNQVSDSWKIRLRAYDQTDISRLSNCTIYFHTFNGASGQVIIVNGGYIQQQGAWYDLTGLSTVYIAMAVSVSDSGTSRVFTYLEALVPNTTTYNIMSVTFEIS